MKLMKSIKVMVILTGLALIYVYMQMEVISLAYEGKRRERQIIELNESNGLLAYKILQLKSANHLGDNLLKESSLLHFQDQRSVVQLVTSESVETASPALSAEPVSSGNPVFDFFFKPPREASAEEKIDPLKPWRRSR